MWGTLLITGLIFFPLTSCIFKKFHDNGWMFSKIIGVAVSGILIWLLSYMKILKFTTLNCYIIIGILFLINILIFIKNKNKIEINNKKISNILTTEIIFCIILIFWVSVRSYMVKLDHTTEQFMNYGFMNVIMNTDYMPAEDIWFSGHNINYYYFGQYISAFLTKISFLQINEGYNLMLALIGSLTFMLPYTIAYNLGRALTEIDAKKSKKIISYTIAIVTGLSISIGGTLYYPIYKWISPNSESYFYADPTRYIGYRPETNDKTITDTPSYSNITRDLHAHYVDTMFVFTTLAILLQIILEDKEENTKKRMLSPKILLLGVILGIQKMTNFWDFPIYLVVISAIIIATNILKYKISKKTILIAIAQILEIVLLEELITLPFTKDLYISATKVYFTNVTSPLYKLAVMWAFPTICFIANLIVIIRKLIKDKQNNFMDKLRTIKLSDMYIMILGACALGLVLLPEIVYLKDIYGDEFKRANTMFKLTYQAYILFSISASYIIIKLIYDKGHIAKKIFAGILLFIQLTTFGYGIDAIQYVTGYQEKQNLANAEYYIKENYPDDYEAIQWIKSNIERDKVILENASGSYNVASRVSVFTANPTVLAWHGHEWIWRAERDYSSPKEENERWANVHYIYTYNNEEFVKSLIEKYNISYIYIGNVEFKEKENLNLELLLNLGEVVYKDDENYSLSPVYIVKVD